MHHGAKINIPTHLSGKMNDRGGLGSFLKSPNPSKLHYSDAIS